MIGKGGIKIYKQGIFMIKLECPNCNRIIPNKAHLIENGCKWCVGITEVWDKEWDELLEGVADKEYITPTVFIHKIYYYLNYKRGFPGWEIKFVNRIRRLIKRVK